MSSLNILQFRAEYERQAKLLDHKLLDPRVIDEETARKAEIYKNYKLTYLEQETKNNFLNALLESEPTVLHQSHVDEAEREAAQLKSELASRKSVLTTKQEEVCQLAKSVCTEYEYLNVLENDEKIQAEANGRLQEELAKVQGELDDLNMLKNPDEELNLSPDAMKKLYDDYTRKIADYKARETELIQNESQLQAILDSEQEQLKCEQQELAQLNRLLQRKVGMMDPYLATQSNDDVVKFYEGLTRLQEKLWLPNTQSHCST